MLTDKQARTICEECNTSMMWMHHLVRPANQTDDPKKTFRESILLEKKKLYEKFHTPGRSH